MTDPLALEPILGPLERGRPAFNEDLPHDERYALFEEHVAAGLKIEATDWMPDEYRTAVLRFVEMHANSELMGVLPEREWLMQAPTLRRKLALAAKVQDEVGLAVSPRDRIGRAAAPSGNRAPHPVGGDAREATGHEGDAAAVPAGSRREPGVDHLDAELLRGGAVELRTLGEEPEPQVGPCPAKLGDEALDLRRRPLLPRDRREGQEDGSRPPRLGRRDRDRAHGACQATTESVSRRADAATRNAGAG